MFKIILQILQLIIPLLSKKQNIEIDDLEEEEKLKEHVKKEHVKKEQEKTFKIEKKPSPNFKKGVGKKNEIIVLHHTAGKSLQSDLNWMTNPESKVSAHYLIGRGGEIIQMVEDEDIAWHAGKSEWNGKTNCNLFSIGIELQGNTSIHPLTEFQYQALVWLVKKLMKRYAIGQQNIVAHRDVSPGRKTDVDPKHFDWERFYSDLE